MITSLTQYLFAQIYYIYTWVDRGKVVVVRKDSRWDARFCGLANIVGSPYHKTSHDMALSKSPASPHPFRYDSRLFYKKIHGIGRGPIRAIARQGKAGRMSKEMNSICGGAARVP